MNNNTGFNYDLFVSTVSGWLDPITKALLWIVPGIAIIAILIQGIKYFSMDEQERERTSIFKPIKTLLIACVILESITIIFRIFGFNV